MKYCLIETYIYQGISIYFHTLYNTSGKFFVYCSLGIIYTPLKKYFHINIICFDEF